MQQYWFRNTNHSQFPCICHTCGFFSTCNYFTYVRYLTRKKTSICTLLRKSGLIWITCLSAEVLDSTVQLRYSTNNVSSSSFVLHWWGYVWRKQALPIFWVFFVVVRRHFLFKVSCSNLDADNFIWKKKSTSAFNYSCIWICTFGKITEIPAPVGVLASPMQHK
jgi:hypothetical protein